MFFEPMNELKNKNRPCNVSTHVFLSQLYFVIHSEKNKDFNFEFINLNKQILFIKLVVDSGFSFEIKKNIKHNFV